MKSELRDSSRESQVEGRMRGGKVVVALGATVVAGCKGCAERRRRKLAEYNARQRALAEGEAEGDGNG